MRWPLKILLSSLYHLQQYIIHIHHYCLPSASLKWDSLPLFLVSITFLTWTRWPHLIFLLLSFSDLDKRNIINEFTYLHVGYHHSIVHRPSNIMIFLSEMITVCWESSSVVECLAAVGLTSPKFSSGESRKREEVEELHF